MAAGGTAGGAFGPAGNALLGGHQPCWSRMYLVALNVVILTLRFADESPAAGQGTPVAAPAPLRKYGTVSDLDKLDNTLRTYDRRALPSGFHDGSGGPTNVSCEVYIRSFGSINPATMDYEVDLYLRQRWYDGRLANVNISAPLDLNDPKLVQKIWKPEVFFANAKHAEFQFVTVPNVLVRLSPQGMILYMLRLKLTFSCMMDLYRYPLDVQTCTIELASFSKTKDELLLHWSEQNPIILFENLKLPQFEIQNVSTSLCNETFYIGEYSCLKAEFHLQRSMGYHLVQSYLPTVLIVVISWVSFWLDVEAIPARITLGVTTLLTISSKGVGIQSNLPPVSYVKAIDVWMGVCTMFVFTALLEFTFVNYLWRKKPHSAKGDTTSLKTGNQLFAADPASLVYKQLTMHPQHREDSEFLREPNADEIRTITTNNGNIQTLDSVHTDSNVVAPQHQQQQFSPSPHQMTPSAAAAAAVSPPAAVVAAQAAAAAAAARAAHQLLCSSLFLNRNQAFAKRIDRLSRVGFPTAFAIFCMIYWPYYLYVAN